jgi:site-specific DNA-cytosine methylase
VARVFGPKVFLQVLAWTYFFVKCGGLIGVVLENVVGITNQIGGREAIIDVFLRALREFIPEFDWRCDVLHLADYLVPHTRVRVFLRGLRKTIAAVVPPPLKPFGAGNLRSFLGAYPHTPRSSWTSPMRQNLLEYEKTIESMVSLGTLDLRDVVVIAVDRAADKAYDQQMTRNACPTLTCSNQYLAVLSVEDVVNKTPDHEREFFRRVHDCERLLFQTLPPDLWLQLPSGFRGPA